MRIPGFDIIERLGEGGMAIVWKAYQVSLDRTVAIKILKPQFARNPDEVRDFILEARAAARLKHQNVVQVYDIAEQNGVYYFVMEYISGLTVASMLDRDGKIQQKLALKITKAVAEALDWAWIKNRLIHRDIKPDNIMIDDDGNIKLADLGLARMADPKAATSVRGGLIEGTPNYMSPEQAKFITRLDCRTDMYSMGATLYHMLTGNAPFDSQNGARTLQMHIAGRLPNPRDVCPDVSIPMAQLITKLMMKDPEDRYDDWAEVLKDTKKVSAGRMIMLKKSPGGTPPESTIDPPKGKPSATPTAPQVSDALPEGIHMTFWICILVLWAAFLLNEILPPPPVARAVENESTPPARRQTQPATAPSPEQPATQNGQSQTPPQTKQETPAAPPDTKASAETQNAQPDVSSSSAEENAQLSNLKLAVTQTLLTENYGKANSLVDAEKLKPHSATVKAQLDELKKLVVDVSAMPNLLQAAVHKKLGQEFEATLKGKPKLMLLRAISKGNVNAVLISKHGDTEGQSTTFSISDIDPTERSKWLGPANTPSKCFMKCILSIRASDMKSARDYASNCGILSETLLREVESRAAASSKSDQ